MAEPAPTLRVEPALAVRPITTRPRSLRVILTAIITDLAITIAKFAVAIPSHSAAMFAEALHSLADTTNQCLLLVGRVLGAKPADPTHPFGYGKERFFWPFIVSVVTFSLGGVFSMLRGIHQIQTGQPLAHLDLSFKILGGAFCFEAISWMVAWWELKRTHRRKSVWEAIRESKSPAVIAVFLEDTAALTGILIAASGMWVAQVTGVWEYDGVASLFIGGLLFNVAWVIASETKSLLIGESASPEHLQKMREIISSTKEVERLLALLTMHLGPEEILVNLDLEFKDGLKTEEIELAIDHIEREIRYHIPEVSKIFIEAESITKVVRKTGEVTASADE